MLVVALRLLNINRCIVRHLSFGKQTRLHPNTFTRKYSNGIYNKAAQRNVQQYLSVIGMEAKDVSSVTTEDIRLNYVRLVKEYHPDSSSLKSNRSEFEKLQEAYNYLMVW